jgi:hypothetical protein
MVAWSDRSVTIMVTGENALKHCRTSVGIHTIHADYVPSTHLLLWCYIIIASWLHTDYILMIP